MSQTKEIFFDFSNFDYHCGISIKFSSFDINKPDKELKIKNKEIYIHDKWLTSMLSLIKFNDNPSERLLLSPSKPLYIVDINNLEILKKMKLHVDPCGNMFVWNNKKYVLKQKSCNSYHDTIDVLTKGNIILKKSLSYIDRINTKTSDGKLYICIDDNIYRFDDNIKIIVARIIFQDESGNTVTKNVNTPIYTYDYDCEKIKHDDTIYKDLQCRIIVNYDGMVHNILVSKNTTKKIINVEFSETLAKNVFLVESEIDKIFFDEMELCKYDDQFNKLLDLIHGDERLKCLPHGPSNDTRRVPIYDRFNGYIYIKRPYFVMYELDDKTLKYKKEIISKIDNPNSFAKYPFSIPRHIDCLNQMLYNEKDKKFVLYNRVNPNYCVRTIDYNTSDDFCSWSKHKDVNIDGFDWNHDNHYVPNIVKYPNTNYYICISTFWNLLFGKKEVRILISKNGYDFKTLSVPCSYDGSLHDDTIYCIMGGFAEFNDTHNIFIYDKVNIDKPDAGYTFIKKYTFGLDSLFYIHSDGLGYAKTKPITVENNQIVINYKCDDDGYINIGMADQLDNHIEKCTIKTSETMISKNTKHVVAWKYGNEAICSKVDHKIVRFNIRLYKASIFSISGQFVEYDESRFTHVKFFVMHHVTEDRTTRFRYDSVNLYEIHGKKGIKLIDDPIYKNDNSIVYQNIMFEDNEIITVKLIDNTETFVKYGKKSYKKTVLLKNIELINIL
jgi:hypothetical protein